MGNPALLYQAYEPTVARDIVYGWARGFVGGAMNSAIGPETAIGRAFVFGITVWAACIISSPGNEWRGYTLQPKDRKLPFAEYFKPINPALLYQAYVPTVARDIVYGWARGFVGAQLNSSIAPETAIGKAFVFGITVWAACVISSPGNEWRGYTLQPKDR